MKKNIFISAISAAFILLSSFGFFGCKKDVNPGIVQQKNNDDAVLKSEHHGHDDDDTNEHGHGCTASFDLNVFLQGSGHSFGLLKFRQDPDPVHIVTLDTKVFRLAPNHTYLLQRAVDPMDCNCTSTSWLTLGNLLQPLSIVTNNHGDGRVVFSRDLSVAAPGTTFDIHFQVVDAVTGATVLTSNCRQFMVR